MAIEFENLIKFKNLYDNEKADVEGARVFISMLHWKAQQMSDRDTEAFSKGMMEVPVHYITGLLNIIRRLDAELG